MGNESQMVNNYINGQSQPSLEGSIIALANPSTGETIDEVTLSTAADALEAVRYSKAAQPQWAMIPIAKRLEVLARFKQLLLNEQDDLSQRLSREQGKTVIEAHQELEHGLQSLDFALELKTRLHGNYISDIATSLDRFSLYQPVGVCVGITPYTFPALGPLWMFPLALGCGNSFILKPSEKTPSIALRFAELLTEAGLPDGVFQVLQGDKEVVDVLLEAPDVAAVSFIGSTHVAKSVYRHGTNAGKRVQALGSSKNHLLVMPDADLNQVSEDLLKAAFAETGQHCMAIAVAVVVGDDTADQLVTLLTPKVQALHFGLESESSVNKGPLISEALRLRVRGYIEQGIKEGATLLVDGREQHDETSGFFLGASLFDHVTREMRIYREEILGPVLAIVRVESYNQGLELINSHSLGHGAAIYTHDAQTAHDFTYQVQSGTVSINSPLPIPMAYQSIGGWKGSLFGALNLYGEDGIRFYSRIKNVTSRWPNGSTELIDENLQ